MQVPEAWIELELDESLGQVLYAHDPMTASQVIVAEEDTLAFGLGELSLDEYAEILESAVLIPLGAEDITSEHVQTEQGLSAIRMEMSFLGLQAVRLIYLSASNLAINVSYVFLPEQSAAGQQLADYSFGTLRLN